jgi:hypothetical protein
VDVGSCGLGCVKACRLVFLVANDAEHVIERSNALRCKDRLALDFIDAAFLTTAGLRIAFGPSLDKGPLAEIYGLRSFV